MCLLKRGYTSSLSDSSGASTEPRIVSVPHEERFSSSFCFQTAFCSGSLFETRGSTPGRRILCPRVVFLPLFCLPPMLLRVLTCVYTCPCLSGSCLSCQPHSIVAMFSCVPWSANDMNLQYLHNSNSCPSNCLGPCRIFLCWYTRIF